MNPVKMVGHTALFVWCYILSGVPVICEELNILDTKKYLSLDDQHAFLESMARLAPESVKLKVAGDTEIPGKNYTNKIYVIHIGNPSKPMLFFDCGMHAREWISSATCLYIIQKLVLVFEYDRQKRLKKPSPVLNYLWSIMPNMNPDGYAITHSEHRMHRKNGRPAHLMNLSKQEKNSCADECKSNPTVCTGVDLNRNFPSGWGLGDKEFQERSKSYCSDIYKGPEPLSEPETRTLHKYVTDNRERMLSAISIHSYSREIYYPKGWLLNDDPEQITGEERKLMEDFAQHFNKELGFRVGNVATLLEKDKLSGGATDDYYGTYQHFNICYTIELDPTTKEEGGFELPPENIAKIGKKLWRAFQRMAEKMDLLYPSSHHPQQETANDLGSVKSRRQKIISTTSSNNLKSRTTKSSKRQERGSTISLDDKQSGSTINSKRQERSSTVSSNDKESETLKSKRSQLKSSPLSLNDKESGATKDPTRGSTTKPVTRTDASQSRQSSKKTLMRKSTCPTTASTKRSRGTTKTSAAAKTGTANEN